MITLLAQQPAGGCPLALPGLQQLLGNTAHGAGIHFGVDGAIHPFQLKALAKAEGGGGIHGICSDV